MSTAETWTVGRLLTWTAEYLKKNGSTSPRLDAEVLLAEARGCQRIDLYTAFAEEPSETVRASFKEMVRRRAEGTPVAYLVGRKEFYSLTFEVNPDVLIPRPETEHLVVEAIDRAKLMRAATGAGTPVVSAVTGTVREVAVDASPSDSPSGSKGGDEGEIAPRPRPVTSYPGLRIADVGTGSGIVALCLAKSLPGCSVTAIDLSPAALALAKRNIAKHGLEHQIAVVQSDLFAAVPSGQFDLIASNPPYVSEAEYAALSPGVRNFEPRMALVAADEGTEIISRLVAQAADRLVVGGFLMFELSPMIVDRVCAAVDRSRWSEPHITKDLAGLPRIVTLKRIH